MYLASFHCFPQWYQALRIYLHRCMKSSVGYLWSMHPWTRSIAHYSHATLAFKSQKYVVFSYGEHLSSKVFAFLCLFWTPGAPLVLAFIFTHGCGERTHAPVNWHLIIAPWDPNSLVGWYKCGTRTLNRNVRLIKTRRRVARKHFSSRRKSECELSVKCSVWSV